MLTIICLFNFVKLIFVVLIIDSKSKWKKEGIFEDNVTLTEELQRLN
jgi:hypothetical protein